MAMYDDWCKNLEEQLREGMSSRECLWLYGGNNDSLLEQSDDVSVELLTPILASLERNNEEISTSARKLGESVLAKCAVKLKHSMKEAVKSLGLSLNGYSEIVATICDKSNGEVEHNSGIISIQKEKREAAEQFSKPFMHDDEIVAIDKNDQAADESEMPATKRRQHLTTEHIQTEIDNSASISKRTTKSKNFDDQSLKLVV